MSQESAEQIPEDRRPAPLDYTSNGGVVEVFRSEDGRLVRYVRDVDHDAIVQSIAQPNVVGPVEYDDSPRGDVTHLNGNDGKLRGYVRLADHNAIIGNIVEIFAKMYKGSNAADPNANG